MKAAVLGAGSWGTALANILAQNGHETTIWGRDKQVVEGMNTHRENSRYLPGAALSSALLASDDLSVAVAGAELVLLSVPSRAVPELLHEALPYISSSALVAHAVKGFIRPDNQRISEYIASRLEHPDKRLAVISGPSHAEEVIRQVPTTVVVASKSQSTAELVQDALMNATFRVYTQADIVGVELGGTLKNIIALGVGMADGLGLGDNTKAALMTRGLAEMTRLGIALGASPLTFSGLAGIGDLIVTCTSTHSRNFRAGRLLATGLSLEETLARIGMAVEGVGTTFAAFDLAQGVGVELPITAVLKQVLEGVCSAEEAVCKLMQRDKSHEMEDVGQPIIAHQWQYP
ncbi:glycerol-3-phosphate dehydrogenase [NAD(P)+] [Alicyclobacillus acidoterrestris]|uniref:NAD(P)H-dependent glycerol-3-phosphate dehydrogenase n=1 Tax=Alicyclobacillus suci TaxID=2816080 RepID=UPI001194A404|nr:NAD(P)H-dependent glycerol-3-phosphate dehydrogenase [Alicyclobacillus suci]GEO26299.1 glycerol-3-phosphate dehydrogenase [NAD(P)+] [Alicyclobacillus acidoterrestris]